MTGHLFDLPDAAVQVARCNSEDTITATIALTFLNEDVTLAQDNLTRGIVNARRAGHTWQHIANCLGVTRQAAQQRYGDNPGLSG